MRIAIVGRGEGWNKAPEGVPIWTTISALPNLVSAWHRPVERCFDMHVVPLQSGATAEKRDEVTRARPLWKKIINDNAIPTYMCEEDITIPTSIKYPLDVMISRFDTDYFSNTMCYIMALAIFEGVKAIDFYGFNMALGTEYEYESSGVEYWIGRAQGQGIEVKVHGNSELLKVRGSYGRHNLYGYGIKQRM